MDKPLEALLVSGERSTVKVKALVHATRAGDPASAEAVRKHISTETNPFVLATMASVLGRAGTPADGPLLAPLLDHADARVVANALQAHYLLKLDLAPDRLANLAKRDDARVRANALAILGRYNPEYVMERIASLSESTDAMTRAGVAYLLGEMPGHPEVLKRLFRMLEVEERTGVVKQLGSSVTKHAVPERAEAVIGHLFELRGRVSGGKVALVAMLLQEVGVELGLVEAEVNAIGEKYLAAHAPKPVAAPSTPGPRAPDTDVSGDVEINASEIWGAPPAVKNAQTTAGRKRPADLGAPSAPAPLPAPVARSRPGYVAAAAVLLVGFGWMMRGGEPAPPAVPRSEMVRAKPAVQIKTQVPTRVIVSDRQSGGSVGGGDVGVLWKEPGVAERLGPVGAPVDVEGTITAVSPGRAVLYCLGRYYVVRGRDLDRKIVGAKYRARGRIQGIASSGLIYVDTEA